MTQIKMVTPIKMSVANKVINNAHPIAINKKNQSFPNLYLMKKSLHTQMKKRTNTIIPIIEVRIFGNVIFSSCSIFAKIDFFLISLSLITKSLCSPYKSVVTKKKEITSSIIATCSLLIRQHFSNANLNNIFINYMDSEEWKARERIKTNLIIGGAIAALIGLFELLKWLYYLVF